MTPEQRTFRAQIAAYTQWAKEPDPTSRTAKARAAADDRFAKQARELHPHASEQRIGEVAAQLRKAHYKRMSLASARARRTRAGKAA